MPPSIVIVLPFTLDPGKHPPHDASAYVEVNQQAPDIVQHIFNRVKAMHMCSTIAIAVDNNAEHDFVDDRSSVDVA